MLVADDNASFGTTISRFVASRPDMEVVGLAADGREAVLMAGVLTPDVVVMDLYMPDLDGFEATRRLKSFATPPCVVVMTAHNSEQNRRAALEAGADAFLLKHEVDRGLVETVDDLMSRERLRAGNGGAPAFGS